MMPADARTRWRVTSTPTTPVTMGTSTTARAAR